MRFQSCQRPSSASAFGTESGRTVLVDVRTGQEVATSVYAYANGVIERQPWFLVACCPPNVMRTLASLGEYIASYGEGGVQLHQYVAATVQPRQDIRLRTVKEYPWISSVAVQVDNSPTEAWTLSLRIPMVSLVPRASQWDGGLGDAREG